MVEQAPAWAAVVLLAVLLALSLTGACADAVLALGRRQLAAPFQEGARLLVQQRRATPGSDGLLSRVGGASLLVVASLMVAVVPWGGWTLLDSGVGVVWFNAMELVLWGGLWCAGWGANGAFALVGAHRWTAQVLSSQLPLMFSLICPALAAGSLRVADVEAAQDSLWFVAIMPAAFVVMLGGVLAFAVWGPLSGPVGGDLQGGVLSESSGVDRLLVAVGRYALLAAGAAVSVPLFLGGGSGPLLPPLVWSVLKTVVVLVALVATRRRFALLRPERFAELAFLVVIPLVLLQVLVVAVYVLGRS